MHVGIVWSDVYFHHKVSCFSLFRSFCKMLYWSIITNISFMSKAFIYPWYEVVSLQCQPVSTTNISVSCHPTSDWPCFSTLSFLTAGCSTQLAVVARKTQTYQGYDSFLWSVWSIAMQFSHCGHVQDKVWPWTWRYRQVCRADWHLGDLKTCYEQKQDKQT